MPEEEVLDGTEVIEEESTADASEITEVTTDQLLERIAALETNQRTQATELTRAVGRAQALAAKFDKTGDPQVENKLRGEMASLAELIGDVADSLPEEVLPAAARQRAQAARDAARRVAQDAEIDRRIAERMPTPAPQTDPEWVAYANSVEEVIVADIRAKGLSESNPAFNWNNMSALLRAGNIDGLWQYVSQTEASLGARGTTPAPATNDPDNDTAPVVPTRRPRPAPAAAASTSAAGTSVEDFLNPNLTAMEKLRMLRDSAGLTF